MLDLDGVVYISGDAVPGRPEAIAAARDAGLRLAFVTNNASRPPEAVAEHLRDLGVPRVDRGRGHLRPGGGPRAGRPARPGEPGAAARRRRARREALAEEGLEPVRSPTTTTVAAVVTGYGPDVLWRDIMRAAVLIRDGLPWVASNTDMTIPTSFGVGAGPRCAGADARSSSPGSTPRWPASRRARCSTRRCAGSAASGR